MNSFDKHPLLDAHHHPNEVEGALLYYSNGSWRALRPGTTGQVLQSGGPTAAPAWQTFATYLAWPVGSIFLSVVSTDPATLLGGGTWSRIAEGRFIVGLNAADSDFDAAEETGGAKTHDHDDHPSHTHELNVAGTQVDFDFANDLDATTSGPSVTLTHSTESNLPPYYTAYIWKRTA